MALSVNNNSAAANAVVTKINEMLSGDRIHKADVKGLIKLIKNVENTPIDPGVINTKFVKENIQGIRDILKGQGSKIEAKKTEGLNKIEEKLTNLIGKSEVSEKEAIISKSTASIKKLKGEIESTKYQLKQANQKLRVESNKVISAETVLTTQNKVNELKSNIIQKYPQVENIKRNLDSALNGGISDAKDTGFGVTTVWQKITGDDFIMKNFGCKQGYGRSENITTKSLTEEGELFKASVNELQEKNKTLQTYISYSKGSDKSIDSTWEITASSLKQELSIQEGKLAAAEAALAAAQQ